MGNKTTPTPSAIRYRIVVGGLGIVFDGYSRLEANLQFSVFVARSEAAKSRLAAGSVLLFKDAEIVREFHPFLLLSTPQRDSTP
jgi:hypothetical protein